MAEHVRAYNIPHIISLRRRLLDQAFFEFLGMRLSGQGLQSLAVAVARILGVRYQFVFDSLAYLAGQQITADLAKDIAWRLAGNLHLLKAGEPVRPWSGQTFVEWVPVHVSAMRSTRNYKNQPAGEFQLRVAAGSPCPMLIVKTLSAGFCSMVARHIGFTNGRGALPYYDMAELVNLRFRVRLTPQTCANGRPDYDKIKCSGSLLKWNQDVIGMRRRLHRGQHWPCPHNYDHQCFQCPVGYAQCPAGCHPHTYELRNPNAAVSPDAPTHS